MLNKIKILGILFLIFACFACTPGSDQQKTLTEITGYTIDDVSYITDEDGNDADMETAYYFFDIKFTPYISEEPGTRQFHYYLYNEEGTLLFEITNMGCQSIYKINQDGKTAFYYSND